MKADVALVYLFPQKHGTCFAQETSKLRGSRGHDSLSVSFAEPPILVSWGLRCHRAVGSGKWHLNSQEQNDAQREAATGLLHVVLFIYLSLFFLFT
jgi:hypothetical protein